MTSFVSANGPSVTVTLPPALLCTRTPVAPKCTPSVAMSHPAFMPSSMSLPIDAISASVGGRPLGSCVKMLMKRMYMLLRLTWPATILPNGDAPNRHYTESFSCRAECMKLQNRLDRIRCVQCHLLLRLLSELSP